MSWKSKKGGKIKGKEALLRRNENIRPFGINFGKGKKGELLPLFRQRKRETPSSKSAAHFTEEKRETISRMRSGERGGGEETGHGLRKRGGKGPGRKRPPTVRNKEKLTGKEKELR